MQGYLGLYVIILVFAILSLYKMIRSKYVIKVNSSFVMNVVLSVVFSLSICLANYNLIEKKQYLILMLLFVVYLIAFWIIITSSSLESSKRLNVRELKNIWLMPILSFILVIVLHFVHLCFCTNPAWIQYDTVYQIDQIMSDSYTNHSPVFQTIILKGCIKVAGFIWGNGINNGLFLYALCQIIIFAFSVAYMVYTIVQKTRNYLSGFIILAIYLVFPYHFMYGSYVVKDIIFSYCGMVLVVATYRIALFNKHRNYFDSCLFFIAGLGLCLFRNNGLFVFVIASLVLFVVKTNKKKILLIMSGAIIVISIILKGPFLSLIEIEQTQFSEPLSIPIQQVARVVHDDGKLTEQETAMINEIMSTEDIKKQYTSDCSDPIKGIIQFCGKDDYLEEHKWEYLKLWFDVGRKNIGEYIKAYVDQTHGYWIPTTKEDESLEYHGYDYFYEELNNVDYGIQIDIKSEAMNDFINKYVAKWEKNYFLQIFFSIGAFLWVLVVVCVKGIKKRNITSYIAALGIALVLSLCLATPLAAALRYGYMIFCITPFAIWASLYSDESSCIDDNN